MKKDYWTHIPRAVDGNQNIMLYWDYDNPFPSDIISVVETWQNACPAWNVMLFGKETACGFLRYKFGEDISRLFLTCAIPAMRSDFFRVFWAISDGGIYSDMTFVPKRDPLFFDPEKDVTLARVSNHGKTINGIFYAKKNSKELKLVADSIIKRISKRQDTIIYNATGPGAWMNALWGRSGGRMKELDANELESSTLAIVNFEDLRRDFLTSSAYLSSTRGTDMHWSRLQTRMSIYQDLPQNQTASPEEYDSAPRARQKR